MLWLQVKCDSCGTVGFEADHLSRPAFFPEEIRKKLSNQGWRYLEIEGRDICPLCKKDLPHDRNAL
jgi:hypothetical protein